MKNDRKGVILGRRTGVRRARVYHSFSPPYPGSIRLCLLVACALAVLPTWSVSLLPHVTRWQKFVERLLLAHLRSAAVLLHS